MTAFSPFHKQQSLASYKLPYFIAELFVKAIVFVNSSAGRAEITKKIQSITIALILVFHTHLDHALTVIVALLQLQLPQLGRLSLVLEPSLVVHHSHLSEVVQLILVL